MDGILGNSLNHIKRPNQAQPIVTYSFTTAGATGQNGPSQGQTDAAYAATTLNGQVVVAGGVQSWTVPATGLYTITTAGAVGGSTFLSPGGPGAVITSAVNLTAGQVVNIVVGQSGQANGGVSDYVSGGSGGRGSFVYTGAIGGGGLILAGRWWWWRCRCCW